MKVTVRIGRIRVTAGQAVDPGQLRQHVTSAIEREFLSQSVEGWHAPAKVQGVRLQAGTSGPHHWAELVAGAIAKARRPR